MCYNKYIFELYFLKLEINSKNLWASLDVSPKVLLISRLMTFVWLRVRLCDCVCDCVTACAIVCQHCSRWGAGVAQIKSSSIGVPLQCPILVSAAEGRSLQFLWVSNLKTEPKNQKSLEWRNVFLFFLFWRRFHSNLLQVRSGPERTLRVLSLPSVLSLSFTPEFRRTSRPTSQGSHKTQPPRYRPPHPTRMQERSLNKL